MYHQTTPNKLKSSSTAATPTNASRRGAAAQYLVVALTHGPSVARFALSDGAAVTDVALLVSGAVNKAACDTLFSAYKAHGDYTNAAPDSAWKPKKVKAADEVRRAALRRHDAEGAASEEMLEELKRDVRGLPNLVATEVLPVGEGAAIVVSVLQDVRPSAMFENVMSLCILDALTASDWELIGCHAAINHVSLPMLGIVAPTDAIASREVGEYFVLTKAPPPVVEVIEAKPAVDNESPDDLGPELLSRNGRSSQQRSMPCSTLLIPKQTVLDSGLQRDTKPRDRLAAMKQFLQAIEAGTYRIRQVDKHGRLPLHWLVHWANDLNTRMNPTFLRNTMLFLLEAGSPLFLCDDRGETPLDLACRNPATAAILAEYCASIDGQGPSEVALRRAMGAEPDASRPQRKLLRALSETVAEIPAPRCAQVKFSSVRPDVLFVASGRRLILFDMTLQRFTPIRKLTPEDMENVDSASATPSRRRSEVGSFSMHRSSSFSGIGTSPNARANANDGDAAGGADSSSSDEEDTVSSSRFTHYIRFMVLPFHPLTHGHTKTEILLLSNGELIGIDYTTADPTVTNVATNISFDATGGDGDGYAAVLHWIGAHNAGASAGSPPRRTVDRTTRVTDTLLHQQVSVEDTSPSESPALTSAAGAQDGDGSNGAASAERGAGANKTAASATGGEGSASAGLQLTAAAASAIPPTAQSLGERVALLPLTAAGGGQGAAGDASIEALLQASQKAELAAATVGDYGDTTAVAIAKVPIAAHTAVEPAAAILLFVADGKAYAAPIYRSQFFHVTPRTALPGRLEALAAALSDRPPKDASIEEDEFGDKLQVPCYDLDGAIAAAAVSLPNLGPALALTDGDWLVYDVQREAFEMTPNARPDGSAQQGAARRRSSALRASQAAAGGAKIYSKPLSDDDIPTSAAALLTASGATVAVWAGKCLYADVLADGKGHRPFPALYTVDDGSADSEATSVAVHEGFDPRGIYFVRRGELCRADVVTHDMTSLYRLRLSGSELRLRKRHGDDVDVLSGAQRIAFNCDGTLLLRVSALTQCGVVYSTRGLREDVSRLNRNAIAARVPLVCGPGLTRAVAHSIPRERLCSFLSALTSLVGTLQQRVDHCYYAMSALKDAGLAGGRFTLSSGDADGRLPLHIVASCIEHDDIPPAEAEAHLNYLLSHHASLYEVSHRLTRPITTLPDADVGMKVLATQVKAQVAQLIKKPLDGNGSLAVDGVWKTVLGHGNRLYYTRAHNLTVRMPRTGSEYPVCPLRVGSRMLGYDIVPPLAGSARSSEAATPTEARSPSRAVSPSMSLILQRQITTAASAGAGFEDAIPDNMDVLMLHDGTLVVVWWSATALLEETAPVVNYRPILGAETSMYVENGETPRVFTPWIRPRTSAYSGAASHSGGSPTASVRNGSMATPAVGTVGGGGGHGAGAAAEALPYSVSHASIASGGAASMSGPTPSTSQRIAVGVTWSVSKLSPVDAENVDVALSGGGEGSAASFRDRSSPLLGRSGQAEIAVAARPLVLTYADLAAFDDAARGMSRDAEGGGFLESLVDRLTDVFVDSFDVLDHPPSIVRLGPGTTHSMSTHTDASTGLTVAAVAVSRGYLGRIYALCTDKIGRPPVEDSGSVDESFSRSDDRLTRAGSAYSAWSGVSVPRGVGGGFRFDERTVCRPWLVDPGTDRCVCAIALCGPNLAVLAIEAHRLFKAGPTHQEAKGRLITLVDAVMQPNSEMCPSAWFDRPPRDASSRPSSARSGSEAHSASASSDGRMTPLLLSMREGHLIVIDPFRRRSVDVVAMVPVSKFEQHHLVDQGDLRPTDPAALVGGAQKLYSTGFSLVRQSTVHPVVVVYENILNLIANDFGPLADAQSGLELRRLSDTSNDVIRESVSYTRPPRTALLRGSLSSLSFFYASKQEQLQHLDAIVKAIDKGRANPNQKDADGRTPFHIIATVMPHMNEEEVEMWVARLIDTGCNPHLTNAEGRTAFEMSEQLRIALRLVAPTADFDEPMGSNDARGSSSSSPRKSSNAPLVSGNNGAGASTPTLWHPAPIKPCLSLAARSVAAVQPSSSVEHVAYALLHDGAVLMLNAKDGTVRCVAPPAAVNKQQQGEQRHVALIVTSMRPLDVLERMKQHGNGAQLPADAVEGARPVATLTFDLALIPTDMLLLSTGAAYAIRDPFGPDEAVETLTRATADDSAVNAKLPSGLMWYLSSPVADGTPIGDSSATAHASINGICVTWQDTVYTSQFKSIGSVVRATSNGALTLLRLFTLPGITCCFPRHWHAMVTKAQPFVVVVPRINTPLSWFTADGDGGSSPPPDRRSTPRLSFAPAAADMGSGSNTTTGTPDDVPPTVDTYGIFMMSGVGILVTCGRYSDAVLLFDEMLVPIQRWDLSVVFPPLKTGGYALQSSCSIPVPDGCSAPLRPKAWRRPRSLSWSSKSRMLLVGSEEGLAACRLRRVVSSSSSQAAKPTSAAPLRRGHGALSSAKSGAATAAAALPSVKEYELLPVLRASASESLPISWSSIGQCPAPSEHPHRPYVFIAMAGLLHRYCHSDGRMIQVGSVLSHHDELDALRSQRGDHDASVRVGSPQGQQISFSSGGDYLFRHCPHTGSLVVYPAGLLGMPAQYDNRIAALAALSDTTLQAVTSGAPIEPPPAHLVTHENESEEEDDDDDDATSVTNSAPVRRTTFANMAAVFAGGNSTRQRESVTSNTRFSVSERSMRRSQSNAARASDGPVTIFFEPCSTAVGQPPVQNNRQAWYLRRLRSPLLDGDYSATRLHEMGLDQLFTCAVMRGEVPVNHTDRDGRSALHYVCRLLALHATESRVTAPAPLALSSSGMVRPGGRARRSTVVNNTGGGASSSSPLREAEREDTHPGLLSMGFTFGAHQSVMTAALHRLLLTGASLYQCDRHGVTPLDLLRPALQAVQQPLPAAATREDKERRRELEGLFTALDDILEEFRRPHEEPNTVPNERSALGAFSAAKLAPPGAKVDDSTLGVASVTRAHCCQGHVGVITEIPFGETTHTLRWRMLSPPSSTPSSDMDVVQWPLRDCVDLRTVVLDRQRHITSQPTSLSFPNAVLQDDFLLLNDGSIVDAGVSMLMARGGTAQQPQENSQNDASSFGPSASVTLHHVETGLGDLRCSHYRYHEKREVAVIAAAPADSPHAMLRVVVAYVPQQACRTAADAFALLGLAVGSEDDISFRPTMVPQTAAAVLSKRRMTLGVAAAAQTVDLFGSDEDEDNTPSPVLMSTTVVSAVHLTRNGVIVILTDAQASARHGGVQVLYYRFDWGDEKSGSSVSSAPPPSSVNNVPSPSKSRSVSISTPSARLVGVLPPVLLYRSDAVAPSQTTWHIASWTTGKSEFAAVSAVNAVVVMDLTATADDPLGFHTKALIPLPPESSVASLTAIPSAAMVVASIKALRAPPRVVAHCATTGVTQWCPLFSNPGRVPPGTSVRIMDGGLPRPGQWLVELSWTAALADGMEDDDDDGSVDSRLRWAYLEVNPARFMSALQSASSEGAAGRCVNNWVTLEK